MCGAVVKAVLVTYFVGPRSSRGEIKHKDLFRMPLWFNGEISWCFTMFHLWDLIKDVKSEEQIMFCLGKFILEATFLL